MDDRRFEDYPDVLTVTEAAKLLRLGRNAMYDSIRRAEIPAIRVGRRLLVPKGALFRMLDGTVQAKKA